MNRVSNSISWTSAHFSSPAPWARQGLKAMAIWTLTAKPRAGKAKSVNLVARWEIKERDCRGYGLRPINATQPCGAYRPTQSCSRTIRRGDRGHCRWQGMRKIQTKHHRSHRKSRRSERSAQYETFAGPIFNLYRKTKRFVQGDNCEVFYSGSVGQP